MNYICNLDNNGKGFIIFDCRPGLNAKVNALKGGGVEDISLYKNCKGLFFGCIENIHCVRDSLEGALEKAYYGKENIEKVFYMRYQSIFDILVIFNNNDSFKTIIKEISESIFEIIRNILLFKKYVGLSHFPFKNY